MAKTIARNTRNLDAARGFIPIEMFELWKSRRELHLKQLEIVGLQFIRAGMEIWNERCKTNKVEKQKTLPIEHTERPKMERKTAIQELIQEATKIISRIQENI